MNNTAAPTLHNSWILDSGNDPSQFQVCTIFIQYNFYTGGLIDLFHHADTAPPNTYFLGFFEKAKKTHTTYHNDTFLK